jgi:hypothetical protein
MKEAQAMIPVIHHLHASSRHDHHNEWVDKLPERRAPAAPGPRAFQIFNIYKT